MAHLIEPLALTLLDGAERKFRLTYGALRRVKARLGVASISEMMAANEEAIIVMLYESMVDRALTFDEFCEVVPLDLRKLSEFVSQLGKAAGLFDAANPPKASEAVTSTGSDSGVLPASISV
jgi:hypothetical protein